MATRLPRVTCSTSRREESAFKIQRDRREVARIRKGRSLDYAMTDAGGMADFVRQHALAFGGPYCDCGYKRRAT